MINVSRKKALAYSSHLSRRSVERLEEILAHMKCEGTFGEARRRLLALIEVVILKGSDIADKLAKHNRPRPAGAFVGAAFVFDLAPAVE